LSTIYSTFSFYHVVFLPFPGQPIRIITVEGFYAVEEVFVEFINVGTDVDGGVFGAGVGVDVGAGFDGEIKFIAGSGVNF
jgi:hypothetical protein